jgi:hypothetical protein
MMKAKPFLMSMVMFSYHIFCVKTLGKQAFDSNINACLFENWIKRANPVLSKGVNCSSNERFGLCYGINQQASFAVCYNNNTLIPEFSGHIVEPVSGKRTGGRGRWRNEAGEYGKYHSKFYQNNKVIPFSYVI